MRITRYLMLIGLAVAIMSSCETVKKVTTKKDEGEKIVTKEGGKTGKAITKYMEKHAEEIKAVLENGSVEAQKQKIRITFESGVLFAFNSSELGIVAKANLTKFAEILNANPDTKLLIEGHTDDKGDLEVNKAISLNRANEVANYLKSKGVKKARIETYGYGPSKPKVDNSTAANRALNRRVEIVIYASETLVQKAKNGSL